MIFNTAITRATLVTIIGLFLYGCASTKPPTIANEEESRILQAIEKEPNNPAANASAGDFYYQKFKLSKNKEDADKAVSFYQIFSAQQPNHPTVNIFIYDIYYTLHASNKEANFERLSSAFSNIKHESREYISPPELAEAYYRFGQRPNRVTYDEMKNLALEGIKRSPKNADIYSFLGGIYYDKEQFNSAIAILKQGLKHHPENVNILIDLADSYTSREYLKSCQFDSNTNWQKAIEYYETAKKIDPKNPTIRSGLSLSYLSINKRRLGLNESKTAYQLNPSIDTLYDLIEANIANGKYNDAETYLAEESKYNEKFSTLRYGQLLLRAGNWEKSLDHYKKLDFENGNIYDVMQSTIMAETLNTKWRPDANTQKVFDSPWQKTLWGFWQNKISDESLLNNANDTCEKIEAYTYIGYKHLKNKRTDKAKEYLTLATNEGVPLFVEDAIANHLLKSME